MMLTLLRLTFLASLILVKLYRSRIDISTPLELELSSLLLGFGLFLQGREDEDEDGRI